MVGALPARLAAERTRPARDLEGDYPTLVAGWRERAFSLGVSGSAVARIDKGVVRLAVAGADVTRSSRRVPGRR